MRDWLLVGAVCLCALNAIRDPVFGILAFIFFSTVNPHSMAWDFGQSFPFAQLIAMGVILGVLLRPSRWRIPLVRESILMLMLWAWFILTTMNAVSPDEAEDKLIQVSKILLMVFLSFMLINNEKSLRRLAMVIALSLGFFGLKGGFWFCLTGGQFMVLGPERSFLESNNAIGLALAMNLPWLWYLRELETNVFVRHLMLAMLLFSYPAIVGTFSRGAWLAGAAATALMIWKSRFRVAMLIAIALLSLVIVPLASMLPDRIQQRYGTLVNYDEDDSAQSRLHLWRVARNVALDKPLMGAGFEYYSIEIYQKYYPDFLYLFPGKVWKCHSIWFSIVSEHGFAGLFLWVALIVSCVLSARSIRARGAQDPELSWLVSYGNLLETSFLAYALAGTFVDAEYFDLYYQTIGMVVIIKKWILVETQETQTDLELVSYQGSKPVQRAPLPFGNTKGSTRWPAQGDPDE